MCFTVRDRRLAVTQLLRTALCTSVLLLSAPVIAQVEHPVTYDIAAQSLGEALNAFGLRSGVRLTFSSKAVAGKRAPELRGEYPPREALDILLRGSGLSYRIGEDNSVVISAAEKKVSLAAPEGARRNDPEPTQQAPEEIIVTAQKRAEDAQKVPITLTAFGAEDLERRNIRDVGDLGTFTPGLITSKFSYGTPIFAIRGADNTFSAAGATKPVGVFVDEVYIPRFSASNFSLFDVLSVSVLKGPQGTLFGRNVTGGAILVQTREPSLQKLEANARVGSGNYGLNEISGYLSMPLSDSAASSISIDRQKRDGYGKDTLNGRDEDDADSWAGRAALLFNPSDAFKLRLSGDYSRDKNGGRAMSAFDHSDNDRRSSELGVEQTYDRDIVGGSARMEIGDGPLTLTSVTGYRHSNSFEIFSRTGLSFRSLTSNFQEIGEERERDSAISQEARLNYENSAFNLIAGVFYFQDDSERSLRKYRLAARTGATSLDNFYDQKVETTSTAPFADATWHVTDQFDLTGGARYTYERKDAEMTLTNRTAPAGSFNGKDDHDWSEVTYRAVATYRPTPAVTLYGSYATGFTAGGYNTEADTAVAFHAPFDPETSESYEIGLKSRFAAGRGRFNIAGFSTKYENKQEFVFNGLTFVGNIINATEATSRGVEAELAFSPIRALSLNATFGYSDTKYGRYVIPGGASQTGNELGKSPPVSYSLAADLDQPIAWGSLLANISFTHEDSYFPSASNTLPIPATDILDAQIGIGSADEHWRLMLWGRNLTDREYPLILSNFVVNAEWLAPPRTYGLRISYRY